MILPGKYKQLDGGLYAAMIPYDKMDITHRNSLAGTLDSIINHEAKVHGTEFNRTGFEKVMNALDAGIIKASFFIAAWDVCLPKVIGAEISVPTVAMEWDGRDLKVRKAKHSEDLCLLLPNIRQLISEKPPEKSFPLDTGLAAYFDRESIRHMKEEGEAWRYGEFASTNTKIKRILTQSGTRLGLESDSGIFALNNFTPVMKNRWSVPVEINNLSSDTGNLENSFVASWSNNGGSQQIALSFTNSVSTFRSSSLAQSRMIDTADLPTVAEIKDILTSLIIAGHDEIRERGWNAEGRNRSFSFGGFTPETHFHALGQPKLVAALNELDIPSRKLGDNSMKPGALQVSAPKRPLTIIQPDAPHFALAA